MPKAHQFVLEYMGPSDPYGPPHQDIWRKQWVCVRCRKRQSVTFDPRSESGHSPAALSDCDPEQKDLL